MLSEDDAMNPTNSDLIKGKVFLVHENGQFGTDAIIKIDMMDEVGINVDGCGDQRILEISLGGLRSDLVEFHSTVFQQQAREE